MIAEGQLAGKGTKGRSFASPRGKGIYLSALFRPQIAVKDISLITPFAAVAVARATQRVAGISPGIKWVNDILLSGKKLGGILWMQNILQHLILFMAILKWVILANLPTIC